MTLTDLALLMLERYFKTGASVNTSHPLPFLFQMNGATAQAGFSAESKNAEDMFPPLF